MIKSKKNLFNKPRIYRSADMRPKLTAISEFMPSTSTTKATQTVSLIDIDSGSKAVFHTMKDVTANLRQVYQTENLATFCIGNCDNGMETVLSNFIDCNDTILVGIIGETGKQIANYIRRIGAEVHVLKAHVGKILELKDIETSLKSFHYKIFCIVHGECSTGVLQPIEKIGELCHKYDCSFIADVSNTLGAVELQIDKWKIDVAYGTSQKVFGGLADLVPITMSSTAVKKLERSRMHFKSNIHDLRTVAEVWLSHDETEFIYTKFVHASNLYSLRDKLYAIRNEQLNNVIDRQVTNAKRLQYEIENLFGLELFVTREQHRLPTMIAICIPNRFNEQFFRKYSSERYSLDVLPGVGETLGLIIRIRLINRNANKKVVKDFLQTFYQTLKSMIPDYVSNADFPNVYY